MDREKLFDEFLNAFLALRQNFEQMIRSIDERLIQAQREYLQRLFEEQQKELADWLVEIDQHLIDCCISIEEHKCVYANLSALHEEISQLGGVASQKPEPLPADSVEGAIMGRIQHLKKEGKI